MIIYITDRNLNVMTHASTSLPEGFRIFDDKTVERVETGTNTFECSLSYSKEDRWKLETAVQVGNYILKQGSGSAYDSVYQITDTELDTKAQELHLYAEDAGLDLLNTMCPATTITADLYDMLSYFLPTDWEINIIDAPTGLRQGIWDGESTATERILSVANLFGCEVYYSFDINELKVNKRIVNVVKKRGSQVAVAQLRLNFDIDNIRITKSIANIYTALEVTGGTPEGADTPIDLKNYGYYYEDPTTGDVYEVELSTGRMLNTTAMKRWSSAIDTDGLSVGSFSYNTTSVHELAERARIQLQRDSQVAVNYEVDFFKLPDNIAIGDRVNIIDEQGRLYLEARLLEIETCVAEDTKTAVIGEYVIRSSGISEAVAQLASSLANQRAVDKAMQESLQVITNTVDAMYTLEVASDVTFGTAHLSAKLLKGAEDIKAEYDPSWFKWVLRNDDGEKLLGRGYTLDVDMTEIGYASTILCSFIQPQLYDLTDQNQTQLTDQNGYALQVSFAGVYTQPTRRLLRATATQAGKPTVSREVNLYEKDGFANAVSLFTGNKGGYVVLKPNESGQPEEILVMDSPTIEEATNVWRWNKEGIGYSATGYDGEYTTAWTIDGKFNADFIQAGTLLADFIKGGTLTVGGIGDLNGVLSVRDSDGIEIGSISNEGIMFNAFVWKTIINSQGFQIVDKSGNTLYKLLASDVYNSSGEYEYTCTSVRYKNRFTFDAYTDNTTAVRLIDLYAGAQTGTNGEAIGLHGKTVVYGNFQVTGTKSRSVETDSFGERLLYAYETPTPLFGDIGECVIDSDGYCYVDIDAIFAETIEQRMEYQVFLQKEGQGDCWIAEKQPTYFVVQGTPNLKVAWELKAKQKGFEASRLDPSER